MNKCLPFNKIPNYISRLGENFEVWFTVKHKKDLIWTNDITKTENWQLGIPHVPPKVFFLPDFETLFNNSSDSGTQIPRLSNNKKILFGVCPQDIKAITSMDRLMGCHSERAQRAEESLLKTNKAIPRQARNDNYQDFYYQRRRRQFYIIGMGEFEFSDSICDIFLEENGDVFDIYVKNKRSADDLLFYRGLFSKCKFSQERTRAEFDPLFSNMDKLSRTIEKSYKSKIWDDLAEICLGCGICSYICPLCYCFEISDSFELNNKSCSSCRNRRWNSCFAPDFFEVSGYNFRSKARDRIFNWYHHKFVRMPAEINHVGCVDCGRCIKYCPAKINFKSVLNSLL